MLETTFCLRLVENRCGTRRSAETVSPGVNILVLEPQKGLMTPLERIRCWSKRLNGPRWSRAVGHMGNVGLRTNKRLNCLIMRPDPGSSLAANDVKRLRVVGFLTLALGMVCCVVSFANRHARQSGGRNIEWVGWLGMAVFTVGVFASLLKRWAVVLVCCAYAIVGGWLIIGSLFSVPFPWLLANISLGMLCMIPALSLLRVLVNQKTGQKDVSD